ncbi:MAG TPA: glycosyltransferase family 2 protein [Coleofasciculaceae cyanobacterium]
MNHISLCTIYANRKLHLQNLVRSLIGSQLYPDQLVIVCMNDRLPDLPTTPFPIDTATLNTQDDRLPLAAARNKAAEIATGAKLIFLDVDCICDRHLIEVFNYHLLQEDAIYCGSVRYLHQDWQKDNWSKESLNQQSSPHKLQGTEITGQDKIIHPYELFWSLCFGISKKTFNEINGFDTDYTGYGAEDTDFSFTARSQHIPLYKVSALAYHQFHLAYTPPLNHLAEIVDNARIFYRKWHILPMKKWLDQFADLGYIAGENAQIEIIKLPTETEIQACLKNV